MTHEDGGGRAGRHIATRLGRGDLLALPTTKHTDVQGGGNHWALFRCRQMEGNGGKRNTA